MIRLQRVGVPSLGRLSTLVAILALLPLFIPVFSFFCGRKIAIDYELFESGVIFPHTELGYSFRLFPCLFPDRPSAAEAKLFHKRTSLK